MSIDQITSIIGKIVLYGGGASAIAFGLLKWFGQKWFENQFAKSLQEHNRKQDEILESYKFEINRQFNRITKIHEKEFEVLPEAWYKLQDSHILLLNITSFLQTWPDLNNYSSEQLESFLKDCELLDYQKNELYESNNKNEYYRTKSYWIRLHKFSKKFNEFRKYLRYNKIFLSKDIYDFFSKIEIVLIEIESDLENPSDDNKPWKDIYKISKEKKEKLSKLISNLEKAVQSRLHFEN